MSQKTYFAPSITKNSRNDPILNNKNASSKKLPKSHSFTNLEEKNHKRLLRSQTFAFNGLKKSLKQQFHQKENKNSQFSRNCFHQSKISNQFVMANSLKQAHKDQPIIRFQKQLTKKSWYNNVPSTFEPISEEKEKKKNYFFKKRIYRNTNQLQKCKQKSQNLKSYSFIKNSCITSKQCPNQALLSQQFTPQQKEEYYIAQLKLQVNRIQVNQIENFIPSMIVAHFFQTISTFYRFKQLQKPDEPHLSVFLSNQRRFKNTIIFDMDQTLIHAEPYKQEIHFDSWGQNFDIILEDKSVVRINLKIRPYVMQVLQRLCNKFQIGIFTAANQNYAKQIINKIDPNKRIFSFFLFRQHCHIVQNKLSIKDLRILSNRSIKNIILVDNSPHTYLYQKQNALPIVSFYNDEYDEQILKLESFLNRKKIQKIQDVRPVLREYFKFDKYTNFNDIDEMVNTLYGK